jgi:hypothetical protein
MYWSGAIPNRPQETPNLSKRILFGAIPNIIFGIPVF